MLAALLLSALAAHAAELPVIPNPLSETPRACSFRLTAKTTVVADPALADVARRLREALSPATGFPLPVVRRPGPSAIELRLVRKPDLGPEGYRLDVTGRRVTILANEPAGAFYAVQTLRQLLPADIFRQAPIPGTDWSAPCAAIKDAPRFAWRGALVDVARHFIPKRDLEKFIDAMALYKLNVLQLHLTDDTGWRIEIKKYPRLTGNASSYDLSWGGGDGSTRSTSERAGGYYTQDDVRELVAYAAARHVTIVPEIEMPGHAGAAIFAYPELGKDSVLKADEASVRFFKDVLDEVLALFPGPFVHVGGDEVDKAYWKSDPDVRRHMKELGLGDEAQLESWFIKQMDAYLASKGRRLVGWDEILEGGLAPGATVTSWRGIEGGIAAAKAGHDVVMAPSDHTYLDYYQSRVTGLEPKAIGSLLPLPKAYAFEPVPPQLSQAESRHVLGAEASIWGEYVPSEKALEYMAFPRLSAFAESVWSAKGRRDFDDFRRRLELHFQKLDRLDVRYRRPEAEPKPAATWAAGEIPAAWTTREWDVTPQVDETGSYKVLFQFPGDDAKLDIQRVELLEDGRPIWTGEQPLRTGGLSYESWRNLFELNVQRKPGARYALRATLRASQPSKSAGELYVVRVPAEPPPGASPERGLTTRSR